MAIHRCSFRERIFGNNNPWLFIGAVDVPFMDMAVHRRSRRTLLGYGYSSAQSTYPSWIWLFIGAVDVKGFVWKKKIERVVAQAMMLYMLIEAEIKRDIERLLMVLIC